MSQKDLLIQNDVIGLRYVQENDRKRFFYLQQDADINRYIRVPQPDSEVESFFQTLIKPWSQKDNAWHGFAVCAHENDYLIGLAFYRYKDKDNQIVEIGWKLHPEVSGQGLATQFSRLLIEYLSQQVEVHKFVAYCDSENAASERIMQKLGMQKEGLFISNFRIGDEWRDDFAYGLVCGSAKRNENQ